MIRGFHNLVESVLVRLGRAPSCTWVDERLPAYYDWDLPEHEFRAMERHLAHCRACKREYKEVVTLVDSIREELAPAQFGPASPAEFAAAVMARIDAYERTRVASAVRNGTPWTQPRVVRVAAGCAVLLVLLATAFLLTRTARDLYSSDHASVAAAPDGSASVSLRTDQGYPGQASSAGTELAEGTRQGTSDLLGSGLQEDFRGELDRALAVLEADSVLPHTDQELDAWARHEYPDVMWLYDVLCKEFGYARTWREFLRESGTLLRFDWPTAKGQPNCRPSFAALQAAASVAGYEVTLGQGGQFVLPNLAWVDVDDGVGRVRVSGSSAKRATLSVQGVCPQPEGYTDGLVSDPSLAGVVLAYLAVSSHLLGSAESERFAADCKVLLGRGRLAGARAADDCASACTSEDEFDGILSLRKQLMESRR
jgi:hypothetical protein